MYLKKFHIKGFRGIRDCHFVFNKGLNVIIGENGAGKSALVDALRICFNHGKYRKDIFINHDDFHISDSGVIRMIEFDLYFEIDRPEEAAIFYDLLVQKDQQQTLEMHFKFFLEEKKGKDIIKQKMWGGENEGQQVPYELFDLINHVYLGALRDAVGMMRPGRGNILGLLFDNLTTDGEKPLTKEYKKNYLKKSPIVYMKKIGENLLNMEGRKLMNI